MIRTIIHRDLHIDYGIPRDDPVLHGLHDAGFDRWDVLLGDNSAHDRIVKNKTAPSRQWRKAKSDMPILPTSATLTDKFSFAFCRPTNGLFVGNLWTRYVRCNLEFSRQPIYQNLQMELPHTSNDGLTGLFISTHAKGRIFLRHFVQRN